MDIFGSAAALGRSLFNFEDSLDCADTFSAFFFLSFLLFLFQQSKRPLPVFGTVLPQFCHSLISRYCLLYLRFLVG